MIETEGAVVRPAPTHSELERAIASVPGVEEAHVTEVPETGKSRLRIRLTNDEDAPAVSWAIAATLRERFGISLDPDAIRPRVSAPDVGSDDGPRGANSDGDRDGAIAAAAEPDDANVVVVGDRILLSKAAREALEAAVTSVGTGTDRLELVQVADPDVADPDDADPDDTNPDEALASDAPGGLADAARRVIDELDELHQPADGLRSMPTGRDSGPGSDSDSGAESETVAGRAEPAGLAGGDAQTEAPEQEPGLEGDSDPITLHRSHTMGGTESTGSREDSGRATIRHLDTRVDVSDVQVTATLSFGGRTVTGHSRSVPTQQGILRAVAEATVAALRALTGDRLVAGIDSVTASVAGDPPMATVLVSIVTDRGDETLLGSSLVRQDPERAVMRATLDALNRRVEPWLEIDIAG